MRHPRLATSMLMAIAAVVMGACGGGERGASREAGPWMLEASLSEAGAGVAFCEEVTAGVAEFMSRLQPRANILCMAWTDTP